MRRGSPQGVLPAPCRFGPTGQCLVSKSSQAAQFPNPAPPVSESNAQFPVSKSSRVDQLPNPGRLPNPGPSYRIPVAESILARPASWLAGWLVD